MIKPLAFYIGLRYTRAKHRNHFISFIALASMLGIALGVTVLITVLSVMNGFDDQIRNRFFALTPEVTVLGDLDSTDYWHDLQKQVAQIPEVVGSAPYINGQGLLMQNDSMQAVSVLGIVPNEESRISQLASKIKQGQLNSLQPNQFNIVIGQEMATRLNLHLGDKISVLTPIASTTPLGIIPRFKRFTISGIFHASSGFGFDLSMVYINLADAKKTFCRRSAGY